MKTIPASERDKDMDVYMFRANIYDMHEHTYLYENVKLLTKRKNPIGTVNWGHFKIVGYMPLNLWNPGEPLCE